MCGAKTTNLATNICHAEAEFWRGMTKAHGKKSRGALWKMLLELGLAQMDPVAAEKLAGIREHYRKFGAAVMLLLFLGTCWSHDQAQRSSRTVRVAPVRLQQRFEAA